jgi:hypothetical protein
MRCSQAETISVIFSITYLTYIQLIQVEKTVTISLLSLTVSAKQPLDAVSTSPTCFMHQRPVTAEPHVLGCHRKGLEAVLPTSSVGRAHWPCLNSRVSLEKRAQSKGRVMAPVRSVRRRKTTRRWWKRPELDVSDPIARLGTQSVGWFWFPC